MSNFLCLVLQLLWYTYASHDIPSMIIFQDNQKIGIGSGSTIVYAVDRIGKLLGSTYTAGNNSGPCSNPRYTEVQLSSFEFPLNLHLGCFMLLLTCWGVKQCHYLFLNSLLEASMWPLFWRKKFGTFSASTLLLYLPRARYLMNSASWP